MKNFMTAELFNNAGGEFVAFRCPHCKAIWASMPVHTAISQKKTFPTKCPTCQQAIDPTGVAPYKKESK